jgi:hypothetical protein
MKRKTDYSITTFAFVFDIRVDTHRNPVIGLVARTPKWEGGGDWISVAIRHPGLFVFKREAPGIVVIAQGANLLLANPGRKVVGCHND